MTKQEFVRFTKIDPKALTNQELKAFAVRCLANQAGIDQSQDDDDQADYKFLGERRQALLEELGSRLTA